MNGNSPQMVQMRQVYADLICENPRYLRHLWAIPFDKASDFSPVGFQLTLFFISNSPYIRNYFCAVAAGRFFFR